MLLQIVYFVFYLINLSRGLSYDDLAKDECFKKIYVCGDYRVSITGGTGRLVTEPYRFGEICRRHKEFIACVNDASHFCAKNFSDLALMVFDNRRSVNLFCTDFEWKKNYFQSAACINGRELEVKEKCRREEDERIDDRPWWCLIPEPCEAIQRVFDCTVRKMEKRCGSIAAEVFRRIHLLKVENQDVVCEFRLRNPRYCRYDRYQVSKAPNFKDKNEMKKEKLMRRIGQVKSPTSKAMNHLIISAITDLISILKKMKLLSLHEDSKTVLLKNLLSINYKLKKLIRDFNFPLEDIFSNDYKNFADKKSSFYNTENDIRIQFIKESLFELCDLLHSKDLTVITDNHMEFSWKNLKDFPIEQLSCFWLKSFFKCNIKVLSVTQSKKVDSKVFKYDMWKLLSNASAAADIEHLLDLIEFESSLSDEGEEFKPVYDTKSEMDLLVFITIDDSAFISSLNLSDIHRSGHQLDDSEVDSDTVLDSIRDVKCPFLIRNANKIFLTEGIENFSSKVNIESLPARDLEQQRNSLVKQTKSSEASLPTANLEFSESKNEEYQLRKLEDVLDKRFRNADIVSDFKDSKPGGTTFSNVRNAEIHKDSCRDIHLKNYYTKHCKTNINSQNKKSFNSNVEIKLNRDEILLELLNLNDFIEV